MSPKTKSRRDVYQEVTDAIIARLDQGTVPWRQSWTSLGMLPISASTNKPYRGINTLLLLIAQQDRGYASPYWGTYKRISEAGGQVRRGEKGSMVTFWRTLQVKDEDADKSKSIPFLRTYVVFNVEQADWPLGMPQRFAKPAPRVVDPITEAEAVMGRYLASGGPTLEHGGDRAFYRPSADHIQMPIMGAFKTASDYYGVLFHEAGHSTGHSSRLDRDTVMDGAPFGSPVYSREELVAELTAAMVTTTLGISTSDLLDNSASYISGWRAKLTDDPKAVVWAAGRAQKAADLILGVQDDPETDEEE